jgi:hypothetical protein
MVLHNKEAGRHCQTSGHISRHHHPSLSTQSTQENLSRGSLSAQNESQRKPVFSQKDAATQTAHQKAPRIEAKTASLNTLNNLKKRHIPAMISFICAVTEWPAGRTPAVFTLHQSLSLNAARQMEVYWNF